MSDTGLITPNGEYIVDISVGDWDPNLYPEGTIAVPLRPASNYTWDGVTWVEQEVPVTTDDVNRERDRRLSIPFPFGLNTFDIDPVSKARISGAGTLALGAMINGAQPGDLRWHGGDYDFTWIAAENVPVYMDAQTVYALGQTAASREARLVLAAKALKTMDPIPQDYTDDMYW